MKRYIRKVTETITYIETCDSTSSNVKYVDRDKLRVKRYRVGKPAVDVSDEWREQTEFEAALTEPVQSIYPNDNED